MSRSPSDLRTAIEAAAVDLARRADRGEDLDRHVRRLARDAGWKGRDDDDTLDAVLWIKGKLQEPR